MSDIFDDASDTEQLHREMAIQDCLLYTSPSPRD